MKTELVDLSHTTKDADRNFDHKCVLGIKTTDDDGNISRKKEQGYEISGKDCIYLNAPKIYPSSKTPLLTDAPDIVGAINELFMLEPEGGEWKPPDMPDPEPYEIYLLLRIFDLSAADHTKVRVELARPSDTNTGNGTVEIDWGDGTVYKSKPHWSQWDFNHQYSSTGQYLVKITTDKDNCFWQRTYPNGIYSNLIAAKCGSEIVLNNDNVKDFGTPNQAAFFNQYRLQYVMIKNKWGLPCEGGGELNGGSAFENCYALHRVDMDYPQKIIYTDTFANCRSLTSFDFSQVEEIRNNGAYHAGFKKIDLPKCVSIDASAFQHNYNLEVITAPLCKEVGDNCFNDCYYLLRAEFAEDCTFGSSCFTNCYSLYPRPDGSYQ